VTTRPDLNSDKGLQPGSTASDLLAAAKRLDPEAWQELVDRYSWLIARWSQSEGIAPDDSPDLVQAVLLEVVGHLDRFEKDGRTAAFRRWLRTITRAQVAEFFRKAAKQPRAQGGSTAHDRLQRLPAEESSTAIDPRLEQLLERFWALVERLEETFEPSTWQAFWLTTFEHRTSVEAGQVLGISPAAVRLAKARVLRRIREEDARLANELKRTRSEQPANKENRDTKAREVSPP
jgi:RNA polymerase sigma-70 factor (ECF subfamily)